jgi:hypothetical protein
MRFNPHMDLPTATTGLPTATTGLPTSTTNAIGLIKFPLGKGRRKGKLICLIPNNNIIIVIGKNKILKRFAEFKKQIRDKRERERRRKRENAHIISILNQPGRENVVQEQPPPIIRAPPTRSSHRASLCRILDFENDENDNIF